MATLTTMRPDGTGTLSSVNDAGGGTTNVHLSVDDDPDSPTTTDYIKNADDTTGNKTAFLLLSATDADFATMTTLQVDAHLAVANFSDDTCTLFARVYQSDETTVLTDEVQVATQAQTGLRSVAFTGVNTTADKATWDAARLRLRWAYTRSMGADGGQQRVTAVELDGTYAVGVASESKSDSDSATVSEAFTLTASLSGSDSATVTDTAGSLTVVATGSDSAAVAESTDGIALTGSDSATVAEAGSYTATLAAADSIAVADTGSGSATFAGSDSATVTDNDGTVDETVGKAGSDSATFSESAVVSVTLVADDSATVTDTGSAAATVGTSDSATLSAETSSLTVSLAHADSATISEAFATIVATLADLESLTFTDVGSAVEALDKDASDSFTMTDADGTVEESVYVVNQTGRAYVTVGSPVSRGSPGAAGSRITIGDDGRSDTQ